MLEIFGRWLVICPCPSSRARGVNGYFWESLIFVFWIIVILESLIPKDSFWRLLKHDSIKANSSWVNYLWWRDAFVCARNSVWWATIWSRRCTKCWANIKGGYNQHDYKLLQVWTLGTIGHGFGRTFKWYPQGKKCLTFIGFVISQYWFMITNCVFI